MVNEAGPEPSLKEYIAPPGSLITCCPAAGDCGIGYDQRSSGPEDTFDGEIVAGWPSEIYVVEIAPPIFAEQSEMVEEPPMVT